MFKNMGEEGKNPSRILQRAGVRPQTKQTRAVPISGLPQRGKGAKPFRPSTF